MSNPILEIERLRVEVGDREMPTHAVRDASIRVEAGSRLGVIGESGSGKTITALSVLRLLPPSGRVVAGDIRFQGNDLLQMSDAQLRDVRGKGIGIVFQNAQVALNPLFPVGRQIADVYRHHEGGSATQAWQRAVAILDDMGIPDPERRARAYPHQYSGGMAQRAMVAMALICSPQLLIADEPTTGLDLTIQAQVLSLIDKHVRERDAALLLISHDLAVISAICTHVAVMYAGEVVETGTMETLFATPRHPYTVALLECFAPQKDREMSFIPGRVPVLQSEPVGCAFAPRCPLAQAVCGETRPQLREIAEGQWAACHFA